MQKQRVEESPRVSMGLVCLRMEVQSSWLGGLLDGNSTRRESHAVEFSLVGTVSIFCKLPQNLT
jgi:hypothetical protein